MKLLPRPRLTNPVHLLAFGFGSGCSPKAPGTMGTLVAVVIYLGLAALPPGTYLVTVAAITVVGIWICDRTARDLDTHDHPGIVWDEIAGYLIAMGGVPFGPGWVLAGFLLFRLFDIWKPWPIGWLDRRVGGGLGIMLDDVVAGLIALACLHGANLVLVAEKTMR